MSLLGFDIYRNRTTSTLGVGIQELNSRILQAHGGRQVAIYRLQGLVY